MTDEESSEVSSTSCSSDESDQEIVAGLAISTPTKAKSSPSTTPRKPLCLMAKSDKVRTFDDSSSDDDDDAPSYGELVRLIKDQDKAIKKLLEKNEKLKKENKVVTSKVHDCKEQDPTLLTKLESMQEENKVTFGDNSKGKVEGLGKIEISKEHSISNVLLVDSLSYNLLSVGQLCDIGFACYFTQDEVIVTKREDGKEVFKGFQHNNLYVVDLTSTKANLQECLFTKASKS